MLPEDRFLYTCTRQKLTPRHIAALVSLSRACALRWDLIYQTAAAQGVAPLLWSHLAGDLAAALAVPSATLDAFKSAYLGNILRRRKTVTALQQALQLFAEHGIDVMLVKGEALNYLVYDQPWYMETNDVDLVLCRRPDEIDPAVHQKIQETLHRLNNPALPFARHIEYDYVLHHDFTMNGMLPINPDRVWRAAIRTRLHDHDVLVMCPEDMLLAAVINACRKRFFNLKALCNIVEILYKYPQLDWAGLAARAQAYHCHTIAFTALLLAKMTLDCDLPPGALDQLWVSPPRALLIRRLVAALLQRSSLATLSARTGRRIWDRNLSWSLLLTYATYPWQLLPAKAQEIHRAWRSRPVPENTSY